MSFEPVPCQPRHGLERSGLFEQVSRPRDDLQALFAPEPCERFLIEAKNQWIVAANDEQRWSLDLEKCLAGEIGPSTSRDDRTHDRRALGGCHEGRTCAGTRTEVADTELARGRRLCQPVCRRDEARREQADVEAEVTGPRIYRLLFRGQKINEQGREVRFIEDLSDVPVTGAKSATPAAVGKQHDPLGHLGQLETALNGSWARRDPDELLFSVSVHWFIHESHLPVLPAAGSTLQGQRSRMSEGNTCLTCSISPAAIW